MINETGDSTVSERRETEGIFNTMLLFERQQNNLLNLFMNIFWGMVVFGMGLITCLLYSIYKIPKY